jgi:ABC-type molybdate transport system substrate-binding protein
MTSLPWPPEAARYPDDRVRSFVAPGSNWVLDFHGDPQRAELALFSDGNHHMALEAAVRAFLAANPEVGDVFYTTTPPAPLVDALKGDGLALGNLRISRKPDVFIGPDNILRGLADAGLVSGHSSFAQSRGNVLLLRKGNPKGIASVADLLRDDVTVACSNPRSERASFEVYEEALRGLARAAVADEEALAAKLSVAGPRSVHSQVIHHREVPQLIGAGHADAALIYYHLALRYSRIFPELFEFIDLGGVLTEKPAAPNPTTRYHIGLVGDGGAWGERFVAFMRAEPAQKLYEEHGLVRLC